MLSTTRTVKGLVCRDIYFAVEPTIPAMKEDLQLFLQATRASHDSQPFVTSVVDLSQPEETIAGGFKKSTAYDVRRGAEKDLVTVQVLNHPTTEEIDDFAEFFDVFAGAKEIGHANRRKLKLLAEAAGLTISLARCGESRDEVLAAHAYIVGEGRARLLYSGTNVSATSAAKRQVIGRANKCMHWKMLSHFKARGLQLYDFGGLGKCAELRSIDEFKESFGGREIVEYNCTRGVTLKGKLAVFAMRTVQRTRMLLKQN
jgi:lipid II:glycine glycyltransferase (peptidoglycan interpeptide bridge formation enzyme)